MFNIVRRDEGDVTVQHPDFIYFREWCKNDLQCLTNLSDSGTRPSTV